MDILARLPTHLLDPGILAWPLLVGLGLFLLIAGQPLGRPRVALGLRLRRLDVDERLQMNARLVGPIGARDPFAGQPLARLFGPLAHELGRRIVRLLGRAGLSGGRQLEESLRAAWPAMDPSHFWGLKLLMTPIALTPLVLGDLLGVQAGPGLLWAPVLALAGFVSPDVALHRRLDAHRTRVVGELNALLILVGLNLRSGLSIEQALVEAGRRSAGPVGQGLASVSAQLQLGQPLHTGLEVLAQQLAVREFTWLVRQVWASSTHGTPLEETLRSQADSLREAHRLAIVRHGTRASLLMLLPVSLILVATFVVLLLPALMQLDALAGGS